MKSVVRAPRVLPLVCQFVFAVLTSFCLATPASANVIWEITSFDHGAANGLGFTVWHPANTNQIRARMDRDPNATSFIDPVTGRIVMHGTLRRNSDPLDSATLGTIEGAGTLNVAALGDNPGNFTNAQTGQIDFTFRNVPNSSNLFALLDQYFTQAPDGSFTVPIVIMDTHFVGAANSLEAPAFATPGRFSFWAGDADSSSGTVTGGIGVDFSGTLVATPEPSALVVWCVCVGLGVGGSYGLRRRMKTA